MMRRPVIAVFTAAILLSGCKTNPPVEPEKPISPPVIKPVKPFVIQQESTRRIQCKTRRLCTSLLLNRVKNNWWLPHKESKGRSVELEVSLDELGELIYVKVTRGSGKLRFDAAAVAAVEDAAPFYELLSYMSTNSDHPFSKLKFRFAP